MFDTDEIKMTQMEQDFMALAQEHEVAASNERLWAKGARDKEQAQMHEENAEVHVQLAEMYRKMLGDVLAFLETYGTDSED